VSADFDRYWNSEPAWPIETLVKPPGGDPVAALRERAAWLKKSERARAYLERFERSEFIKAFIDGKLDLIRSQAALISDDPRKIVGKPGRKGLVGDQLQAAVGLPEKRMLVVSPYFVPTRSGAKLFAELARGGVEVVVLTNALEATDVAAVHSGYSRYRKRLLKAGVKLYEMQRLSGSERMRGTGPLGSSGSSLHAKTFAVDDKRM